MTSLLDTPLPLAGDPGGASLALREESGRTATLTARRTQQSLPATFRDVRTFG